MYRINIVILLMLFLFNSCRKDSENVALGIYPMKNGYEWEYTTVISSKGETGDPALNNNVKKRYMKVVSDWKVNGEICKKALIWDENIGKFYTDTPYVYYGNRKDGLFRIGGSIHFLNVALFFNDKKHIYEETQSYKYSFIPFINPSLLNDKESILNNPIQLTKLPVNLHKSWSSNEFGLEYTKRKWIGHEDISVPVGTFKCMKLQHIFDVPKGVNGNFPTVYQYFSDKGLIKEEYVFFTKDSYNSDEIEVRITTQLTKVNF